MKRILVVGLALGAALKLAATSYTWCGDGGDGEWTNPANWMKDGKTVVEAGYPGVSEAGAASTGDIAVFAKDTVASVKLADALTIKELNLSAANIDLTLQGGVAGTNNLLNLSSTLSVGQNLKLTLDNFGLKRAGDITFAAGTQVTLQNAAFLYFNGLNAYSATALSLSGGSALTAGELRIGGASQTITLDNSSLEARSNCYLGNTAPGGGTVVFKGARPLLTVYGGNFRYERNNGDMKNAVKFDYYVPTGGYVLSPVRHLPYSSTATFGGVGNCKAMVVFAVNPASPALSAGTTTEATLFLSHAGIQSTAYADITDATAALRYEDAAGQPTAVAGSSTKSVWASVGTGPAATPAAVARSVVRPESSFNVTRRTINANAFVGQVSTITDHSELRFYVGEAGGALEVVETKTISKPGVYAFSWTAPEGSFEHAYDFKFEVADLSAADAELSLSATPVATKSTLDTTTYTWIGGASGRWSDAANWKNNQNGDCLGYPQSAAATATFKEMTRATITVDESLTVGTLTCTEPDVDITLAKGGDDVVLTVNGFGLKNDNVAIAGRVKLDGLTVTSAAALTLGAKMTMTLDNAASLTVANFTDNLGGWLILTGESFFSPNASYIGGGGVVISNSTYRSRNEMQFGNSKTDGVIRFEGDHPRYIHTTSNFRSVLNNAASHLDFLVPAGGYATAPITVDGTPTAAMGMNGAGSGNSPIAVNILPESPAARTDRTVETTLVSWPTQGINTSFVAGGTLPAESEGSEFTWGEGTKPVSLGVKIVGSSHANTLTVSSSLENFAAGTVSPSYGNRLCTDSETVTCTAPSAPVAVDEYRQAKCIGYRLYSVDPATHERTLLEANDALSVDVTNDGGWQELEWQWTYAYAVSVTAGAGGSIQDDATGGFVQTDTTVSYTAVPDAGYAFLRWTGAGVDALERIGATVAVTPSDSPVALTAEFIANGATTENVFEGGTSTDWDTAANWSRGEVPGYMDDVIIEAPVTASGANELRANSITIREGGSLTVAGFDTTAHPSVFVRGDLTLNAGAFIIYAGPIDADHDFRTGGAQVLVGGKMLVANGASVTPYVHSHKSTGKTDYTKNCTGAPVVFAANDLEIAEGGAMNADDAGYNRIGDYPYEGRPTTGGGIYATWGGGYGGSGGRDNDLKTGGWPTYGSAYAPFYAGAAAGPNGEGDAKGGGAVRLAARTARIDGTVSANAVPLNAYAGGGAGGGIWITADALTVGETARFSATGAYAGGNREHQKGGGGGGGRIAISVGLTGAQLNAAYALEKPEGIVEAEAENIYPGQFDVAGGVGGCYGYVAGNGGPGTAIYYVNSTVAFPSEPEYVYDAAQTTRRKYLSAQTEGAVRTVVWDDPECLITADAYANGAVDVASQWTKVGAETAAITATPAEGYVFAYWTGDVNEDERFANPLVVTVGEPRRVKAFFASATPGTYTFNKNNNNTWYDWYDAANWTPNGVPGPADTAVMPKVGANASRVFVGTYAKVGTFVGNGPKAMLCVGNQHNSTEIVPVDASTGAVKHKGLTDTRFDIGFATTGDFTLTGGASVLIGGERADATGAPNALPCGSLRVGGDLLVGSGSHLSVFAGAGILGTDDIFNPKGLLKVTGKATILDGGYVHPVNNYATEANVLLDFTELEVQLGGTISADGMGGRNYIDAGRQYCTPWPPYDPYNYNWNYKNSYFGGTHGGLGGNTSTGSTPPTHLVTYGYVNTPINVGMQGGNNNPRGGGVIRINADSVSLAGTLTANGPMGAYTGGGAGGSIWVNCKSFTATPTAVISVKGGTRTTNSAVGAAGGGGGGRASVTVGFTDEQLVALRTSDTIEGVKMTRLDLSEIVAGFTAAGGVNVTALNGGDGQPGTGVYLANTTGACQLTVRGNPDDLGTVEPGYGISAQKDGEKISISAPESVYVLGTDEGSQIACGGWTLVSDETGETLDSGTDNVGEIELSSDATLVWDWTTLSHRSGFTASEGGAITTNAIGAADSVWQPGGSRIALTAVPQEGYVFVGWFGHLPGVDHRSPVLDFTIDGAVSLVAVFAPADGVDRVWNGGNGDWADPAKWTPAGVPGQFDRVTVGSGTVTIGENFKVPAGTLTVAKGATVTAADLADDSRDACGLDVAGDFVLNGQAVLGRYDQKFRSALAVGGNLVVTNGTSSKLTVYAAAGEHPETPAMYLAGGASVDVGGTLQIGAGSSVRPICDRYSGNPVLFDVKRLDVAEGGMVDASSAGYGWGTVDGVTVGYAPGSPPPANRSDYDGGSYGGLGAPNGGWATAVRTQIYGDDFAPYMPGSAGGNKGDAYGGGAIRITCRTANIRGTLNANGMDGGSYGAASGGSIWLVCRRLKTSATTVFTAKGGTPGDWGASGDTARSGGGGGGRICIMTSAEKVDADALYGATELPRTYGKTDLTTDQAKTPILGTVDVSGGMKEIYHPNSDGEPGTAVQVVVPRGFTVFIH